MVAEQPWLYTAMAAYALATVIAIRGIVRARGGAVGAAVNRSYEPLVLGLISAGVILLVMALTERWIRIGHGPFVNLFELLINFPEKTATQQRSELGGVDFVVLITL